MLGGGLVCNLMGMGVPESHAREMERALLFSCTIVSVHTDMRQNEASMILNWDGAQHNLAESESVGAQAEGSRQDHAAVLFAQEHKASLDPSRDNPYRNRIAS